MPKILILNLCPPRLINRLIEINANGCCVNLLLRSLLFVLFGFGTFVVYALECPDIRKVQHVGKEIQQLVNNDLCSKGIKEQELAWIKNTALPQIMTKSFLGVEPPANWSMMADDVFRCYTSGNLCSKKVQEQFAQCSLAQMPIILFQLSPWLTEHCVELNNALFERWSEKKLVLKRLFNEYWQTNNR